MTTLFPPNTTQTIDGYSFCIEDCGAAYSIETIGTNTIRFQVNPGDVWSYDPTTKNRSELASDIQIPYDVPLNISYVMQIEPGSVNSSQWCVLGQIHQQDTISASPPFEIDMNGNYMQVNIGYLNSAQQPTYLTVFQDSQPIVEGANYAFNISATFDASGNGHLVVTRNGVTIVNYSGPLGYGGANGYLYWKEGIYESQTTTTMAVDYSNLSITTGAAVTPPAWNGVQSYKLYDGSGNLVSTTTNQYDSSGNLLVSTVLLASGAKTVSTYDIVGEPYVSTVQQFNAQGTLTESTNTYADGSTDVHTYTGGTFDGVAYASYDFTYTAAGFTSLQTYYNASGAVVASESNQTNGGYVITLNGVRYDALTINADGSYDHYKVSPGVFYGANFNAEDNFYTASNVLQEQLFYNTAGQLVASDVYQTNGGYSVTLNGVRYDAVTINADGSYDHYEVSPGVFYGVNYNAEDNLYSASNVLQEQLFYNTAGQVVASESYQTNGGYSITLNGALYLAKNIDAGGAYDYHYYTPGTFYGVAYASSDNAYTAGGFNSLQTYYNASGAVVASDSLQANGGFSITLNGAPYLTKTVNADGSYEKQYATTAFIYDKAGTQAAQAGANWVTLNENGLTTTLAGASSLSVKLGASAGGDTFSFTPNASETVNAGGTTSDTFIFQPLFGQVALNGFGVGVDVLDFKIGDFSYLNAGMSQAADLAALISHNAITASGTSTIITDSFGDHLTLAAITASALKASPASFLFK
ncbi:MAG: heparin lyase I family protein [Methylocystis sp.]